MQIMLGGARVWLFACLVGLLLLPACLGKPISRVNFPCNTDADCGTELVCDSTNLCVSAPECKDKGKTCEFTNLNGAKLGAGGVSVCKDKKLVCEPQDEITIFADGKKFTIGSPDSDKGRSDDEKQVSVTFDYNFNLGRTEVTQKLFKELMGYNPSAKTDDKLPVTNISWHEAALFANKMSAKAGLKACFTCSGDLNATPYKGTCAVASDFVSEEGYVLNCPGYRLPTESEWEFAYKAMVGAYRSLSNGELAKVEDKCGKDETLEQIAFYCSNSGGTPRAVGQKAPNRWQLLDMSGNAAEWVFDWYNAVYVGPFQNRIGPKADTGKRVVRGGHFKSNPKDCRGTARSQLEPDKVLDTVGFRIARTLVSP
jgi:formylglycine-generating enzyme required for sulfatase activity